MKRISFIFLTFTFLYCKSAKTFTDYYKIIDEKSVSEISIKIFNDNQEKSITTNNKDSIINFIYDLNNSPVDGLWKGAKWDKILLIGNDTTITLTTNGNVFGSGASGQFYKLNKKYKIFWEKK